jgi:hypothetical protein
MSVTSKDIAVVSTLNAPSWTVGRVTGDILTRYLLDPVEAHQVAQQYPNGFLVNSGLGGQTRGYQCDQVGFQEPGWFERTLHLMPTAIYRMQQNVETPFCYIDGQMRCWTTAQNYLTDKGSIPPFGRSLFSQDECLWYLFHDSGYMRHGLYQFAPLTQTFSSVPLTRTVVDQMLRAGYLCQWPECTWRASAIYSAVRAGGWAPWGRDAAAQQSDWQQRLEAQLKARRRT